MYVILYKFYLIYLILRYILSNSALQKSYIK